jgi:indole-3-glycerol phosphate synthase
MILDEIMAHKREELVLRQRAVPLAELKARAADRPPALDFAAALRGRSVGLIAEIKRASPSKGLFCPDLDPEQLATTYASNGATAISVLTDTKFFQGQLEYLARVKNQLTATGFDGAGGPTNRPEIPVMRKDFVFAPYQVYESLAFGADALLLIIAVLSDDLLAELIALTHSLGLTALVEIHNAAEAERALRVQPRVVGINNRNLHDFSVDLATFGRLRGLLPQDVVAVAESGVGSAADVRHLAQMDADAVLVGEALVTAPDVAAKVRELAGQTKSELRQPAAEVVGR